MLIRLDSLALSEDRLSADPNIPPVNLLPNLIQFNFTDDLIVGASSLRITLSLEGKVGVEPTDMPMGNRRLLAVQLENREYPTASYNRLWDYEGGARWDVQKNTLTIDAVQQHPTGFIEEALALITNEEIAKLGAPMTDWDKRLTDSELPQDARVRLSEIIRERIGNPSAEAIRQGLRDFGMMVGYEAPDYQLRLRKLEYLSDNPIEIPANEFQAVIATDDIPFEEIPEALVRYTLPDGEHTEGTVFRLIEKREANLGSFPTITQAQIARDAYRYGLAQSRRELSLTLDGWRGDIRGSIRAFGRDWRVRGRKYTLSADRNETRIEAYSGA